MSETFPEVRRSRPRMNVLAVFSAILAVLLSPLAAVFGHIAAGQVHRSNGAERGAVLAWVSAGFGYLWLVGFIIGAVLFYQAFTA